VNPELRADTKELLAHPFIAKAKSLTLLEPNIKAVKELKFKTIRNSKQLNTKTNNKEAKNKFNCPASFDPFFFLFFFLLINKYFFKIIFLYLSGTTKAFKNLTRYKHTFININIYIIHK